MTRKGIAPFVGVWLAGVLVVGASVYSLYRSYASEASSHRRVLVQRGETVLDALSAGILAHGRMGRYRADRLSAIFEELAKTPGIHALQLVDAEGETVAQGGSAEALEAPFPRPAAWEGDILRVGKRTDIFGAHGSGGAHRGWREDDMTGWIAFPHGDSMLVAVLDATEVNRAIQRDRIHFIVSISVTVVAVVLGLAAATLLLKRTEIVAELERERQRAHRQEQLAQLGAGLAHETKNPLGIVRGLAQNLGDCSVGDCPRAGRTQAIVDEVDRVIRGINGFLALARPPKPSPSPVALDEFFRTFLPLVQMDAVTARVAVEYEPCGARVFADEELLRRALLNLLLNAFHASEPGGLVTIRATRRGRQLRLQVEDRGRGIDPADLPHVTEPYFTRSEGGSGLGLAIVEQIAVSHGWRLGIESDVSRGTRVQLDGMTIAGEKT